MASKALDAVNQRLKEQEAKIEKVSAQIETRRGGAAASPGSVVVSKRSTGILSAGRTDSSRGEPVGQPGVSPGCKRIRQAGMPADPTAKMAVFLNFPSEFFLEVG
jgi:hypothetical protein